MKFFFSPRLFIALFCTGSLMLSGCSTPEQTARGTNGGALGAVAGGIMGGWAGAASGAVIGGLLGIGTAHGDTRYGTYPGQTYRSQSGNTNSTSSGAMGYHF